MPRFLVTMTMIAAALGDSWAFGADDNTRRVAVEDAHLVLAPYVWKCSGAGPDARAEAAMPGAYVRAAFRGSPTVGLVIDAAANADCPAASMPVVEYSVDQGPFVAAPLAARGDLYVLPLADKLDPAAPHRLDVFFRAADLSQRRWTRSTAHLRIAGLELAAGGTLIECPRRPKRAICFGDSITEGVGVDGLFTSWQSLGANNARASWCPIVCTALDCEYGQLGSAGQGIVNDKMELPPLAQTWDRYDAETSRLADGRLLPEPDYVFCAMGTNDYLPEMAATFPAAYIEWLLAVRAACPNARIFCITPPLGTHADVIADAVAARRRAGDARVHLIDTRPLRAGFSPTGRPTQLAHDGVHPSLYGNALLGALIVRQVQQAIAGPQP